MDECYTRRRPPTAFTLKEKLTPYRELVEELRDRVRSLEEANRENRRIIAALTSRIPAIDAPQDASEAAEPRSEGPAPTEAGAGAQEPAERVSWWRRVFGG